MTTTKTTIHDAPEMSEFEIALLVLAFTQGERRKLFGALLSPYIARITCPEAGLLDDADMNEISPATAAKLLRRLAERVERSPTVRLPAPRQRLVEA